MVLCDDGTSFSQSLNLGIVISNNLLHLHILRIACIDIVIYACIEPIIDPLLPQEQAGFRRGRLIVDQVTL